MSQQPIDGISGIKRAAPGVQSEVNDLKQGELALDETTEGDVAARFRGDGVTTPSKVVARFLELNVAKDPLLDTMKGSENAAFLGPRWPCGPTPIIASSSRVVRVPISRFLQMNSLPAVRAS